MTRHSFDVPSACSINYRDADEVCGYQLLLCKMFEREGGLNCPPVSNILTTAIKREGKVWLREVKQAISELFASPLTAEYSGLRFDDIPRILEAYDFFYRICNGAANQDFIRETVNKTVNRYVNGDKSLSQTQVALLLQKEMERDIRTMEKRYLAFSGNVMEGWVDDLERNGKIRQVSESDSYDILHFLLPRDLFSFGVKRESKLRWIKSYALSDEKLDTLDTKTFRRYIGFNQAAEFIAGTSIAEQDARNAYLFSLLAEREDIHPFLKEGLAIDLVKYKTA